MFAGTITQNPTGAATAFSGTIHSTKFDIAIQLEDRTKMSERSPDCDVTAVNRAGRSVRIGTAWDQVSDKTGNRYVFMQDDDQRGGNTFSIIPFVEAGGQERDANAGLALVG